MATAFATFLASALCAACVTVNVYFPAAAAEKAADQIIDSVTGQQGGTRKPSAQTPTSRLESGPTVTLLAAAGRVLDVVVPVANAQSDANLDISSPEIRAITASMQARFGQLEKYFASGVVGLTADGLVQVRDAGSVPLAERATVTRLVAEDNRDRQQLYAEIAKANGHPEWAGSIRSIFARRWVERGAQPGWYFQDSSGAWKQK
jgi:uncharacterized protein YdbL (DUF1318 family)